MNIQIIRTSFAFFAAGILLCGCGSKKTSFDELMSEINAPARRGLWQKDGDAVGLKKVREITLESKGGDSGEGFFQTIFRRNHFYLIDSSAPSIFVYDSSGAYLRAVAVKPAPGDYWAYCNIGLTANGHFLVKDMQPSAILEIDSTGAVVSKWSTRKIANEPQPGEVNVCPFGMQLVESSHGRVLFSSIFQWPENPNTPVDTCLVGRFDENHQLTSRFGRHHPIYLKYNLGTLPGSTITVAGDEVFLVEFFLPTIRAYSYDGEVKREFGVWGAHQRPLVRMPKGISENEQWRRTLNYTLYYGLKTLDHLGNLEMRLIIVSYVNPQPFDAEKSKKDGWTEFTCGDHYLILYSASGELLVNDVPLPGMLIDLDDQGRLVLLLRDDSDDRRIGFYRLEVGQGKLASVDH